MSYSEEVEDDHAESADSSVVPLDGGQIGEHPHLQRKRMIVIIYSGLAMFIMVMKVRAKLIRTHPHIDKAPPYDAGDSEKTFDLRSDHLLSTSVVVSQHYNYN